MQVRELDVAVIGGGCIGSSILYELSHRGIKNIGVVDNGRNNISATAHSGGMLRVFHENPAHMDLALKNLSLLQTHQKSGVLTEKNQTHGSLYFFNKQRYRSYKKNLMEMERAGYEFEMLTSAAGEARFPQFTWNQDYAVYEPQGSQLSPEKFMRDMLVASEKQGAVIIDDFEVDCICFNRNQYRLIGKSGVITTNTLILAGGVRLLPKLIRLGLHLDLKVKNIDAYHAEKISADLSLPNYFDRESLEFGCFNHGDKVVLSDVNISRLQKRKWGKILEKKSAADVYAPSRLGLLGKVPGFANLFIATGWGGTGFKFALEIGHRLVDIYQEVRRSEL